MIAIRRLNESELGEHLPALAAVLLDCIAGGASVSFMASITPADAQDFFRGLHEEVARGTCILLAAFDGPQLVGTVQVHAAKAPNQTHRADIAKLLVLPSARRRGIAGQLMEAAEDGAREIGKTLLVLDTTTGSDAERLYTRLGWNKSGVIPNYARLPDGQWSDTTIFWKALQKFDGT